MSEVKNVITIAERATKTLVTTSTTASKLMAELQGIAATIPALAEEIEFKQGQLTQIENDTKVKIREAKAELTLKITENEGSVLESLMSKRELATITNDELALLRQSIEDAKATAEAETKKAVAIAVAQANSAKDAAHAEADAKAKIDAATAKAQLDAKDQEIKFQEKTIANLESIITEERKARVDEAQARSNSQITVNNSK